MEAPAPLRSLTVTSCGSSLAPPPPCNYRMAPKSPLRMSKRGRSGSRNVLRGAGAAGRLTYPRCWRTRWSWHRRGRCLCWARWSTRSRAPPQPSCPGHEYVPAAYGLHRKPPTGGVAQIENREAAMADGDLLPALQPLADGCCGRLWLTWCRCRIHWWRCASTALSSA